MNELSCFEFQQGRLFVGRLPHGKDLILSVEEFCEDASIQMATFSVIGAVSSATMAPTIKSNKSMSPLKRKHRLKS